jgi:hypothetical protein
MQSKPEFKLEMKKCPECSRELIKIAHFSPKGTICVDCTREKGKKYRKKNGGCHTHYSWKYTSFKAYS